jgi:hypothetical protein
MAAVAMFTNILTVQRGCTIEGKRQGTWTLRFFTAVRHDIQIRIHITQEPSFVMTYHHGTITLIIYSKPLGAAY